VSNNRALAIELTDSELGAWRGFLRTHSRLVAELDSELVNEHDLPLSTYDVLVQLAHAPERRLRMSELADSVLLSPSGLTRLVDRLCRDGLVERVRCDDDARGSYAVLTERGRARFEEARQTHLAGVRRIFLAHLSPAEQRDLANTWERIAG
jgi:DNA-binding MarR family transcriptional regulator